MDQLQPITSAMPSMQMAPVGSVSCMAASASIPSMTPNEQMMLEPLSPLADGPQNVSSNSSALPMMPMTNYSFQQFTLPNNESGDVGAIFSNLKPTSVPMPVKRKSPMENLPTNLLLPREVMPNKVEQLEHRPWLNIYSSNQSSAQHQVQSLVGVLASHQWAVKKKRTTQFQAGPPKSGFPMFSAHRSHLVQGHRPPSIQNQSNENVRSKLRESISAALALVTEKEKSPCVKNNSTDAGEVASEHMQETSQSAEFASSSAPAEPSVEKPDVATECENNMKTQLSAVPCDVSNTGLLQTQESVSHELNVMDMLSDEESIVGNFFVKDDLLQGNGLSWVLDFDAWVAEKEGHETKDQKVVELVDGSQEAKKTSNPQTLALQIEIELFKLYDGVNKKYKEKARSLLFNLKDKNNPELREKVMSGAITPARLCSMTAEELASKELSEWRMAKAEEFEHMKILPDSDIDFRRLVKKTHKGEYQVEVEEDDVSVEVSIGPSSLPQIPTETKETKSPSGQISDGDQLETENIKNNSEEQSCSTTTVPSDINSDLMHGIVEDDLKDAEFLPPIVSLDEFMKSLHKESPSENLSADAEKIAAIKENAHSEVPPETKSAKHSSASHTGGTAKTRPDSDSKCLKRDADTKPTYSHPGVEVSLPVTASKGERLWEGILQLNNSSRISVGGFFKSGEKASTNDWPRTIEIKGRVRLDAFEKFLHDLHKSRSRVVMVMHLILKENEGKESESLSQVVESYVSDDRVGYAEPVRGVEAYLCPCHSKILDKILKHLAKKQTEAFSLADGDRGLIGVFVWRKALVSPNSSSHDKHTLKKHQQENSASSRKQNHQQDRNMNVKSSNLKPKDPTVPFRPSKVAHSIPVKAAAVEDDVPPGFGPPATQDDDDLPEFNFSSDLSRSVPTQKAVVAPQTQNRPSDQMRQLIQKYGQNAGSGLVVEPWDDDDDDDDIPEWQPPQMSLPPAPQPVQHNLQQLNQPVLQHLVNQHHQPQPRVPPSQQPQAALLPQLPTPTTQQNIPPRWPQQQQQQAGLWVNPQVPQQGQFYGTQNRSF